MSGMSVQHSSANSWSAAADIWSFDCIIFRRMNIDPRVDLISSIEFSRATMGRYSEELRSAVKGMMSAASLRPTSRKLLDISLQHVTVGPCLGSDSRGLDSLRASLKRLS